MICYYYKNLDSTVRSSHMGAFRVQKQLRREQRGKVGERSLDCIFPPMMWPSNFRLFLEMQFGVLLNSPKSKRYARREEKVKFTCKCFFWEIYNEQILDIFGSFICKFPDERRKFEGWFEEGRPQVKCFLFLYICSGNVIIRLRPLSCSEISLQCHSRCDRQDSSQAITWDGPPESRFTFGEMLFKVVGVLLVDNCMEGYNSCMFAYDQW
ncbi:hypothetical protein OROMI_008194 [Orobanche minor]